MVIDLNWMDHAKRAWRDLCSDYHACSGSDQFRFKFLLHPGFQVSLFFRCAHFFHEIKMLNVARFISVLMRWVTSCDIHHGAQIGAGVQFPHGLGVVIGEGVVVGPRCSFFQFTTIGAIEGRAGAPVLEEGVNLYPGAVLAGDIKIGEYCRIGPHVYLTESVHSHTRIAPPKPLCNRKEPDVSL